ncbi:MAG: single-stranded DNA-binding protein [candidate division Zixibacteria bacterium]|nr:single-stranded DNA-binding protein [candidate division Zixibacteria bacterium]
MASLNKVFLIGNLGRDPEKRYTPNGQAVTSVTLATTIRWKDKSGQPQEKTDWHNLVIWGRQAENAKEILKKGDQVFVEGRIQNRSYDDRNGNKRYVTEIIVWRVMKLGRKEVEPAEEPEETEAEVSEGTDEDLPF